MLLNSGQIMAITYLEYLALKNFLKQKKNKNVSLTDIEPVEDYLNYVNANIKRKFKQHEFDALVSFIHQIGLTYFAKSTCLRKIREGCTPKEIAKEFPRWCYITDRKTGKKVICDAVKNRHIDEKTQYLTGY